MANTLIGIFEHRRDAETAFEELLGLGISKGELGLVDDDRGRTRLRCRCAESVADRVAAVLRAHGATDVEHRLDAVDEERPRLGGEHPIARGAVQLFSHGLDDRAERGPRAQGASRVEPRAEKMEPRTIPRTDVAVARPTNREPAAGDRFDREYDAELRRSFPDTAFARTGSYEQWAPAYRYGYELARRYRGRDFDSLETDARVGWERTYGVGSWGNVRMAVRHAWEKVHAREERPSLGA